MQDSKRSKGAFSPPFTPEKRNKQSDMNETQRTLGGDVNSGTYTRVHLKVRAETRYGESVSVSGSSFLMGKYNPNEAMTLVTTPETYPLWRTPKPMILPRGVPHQYMYALFAGGTLSAWEPIDTERVLVPDGREMTVVEDFGEYDDEMMLVPFDNSGISPTSVFERRRVEDMSMAPEESKTDEQSETSNESEQALGTSGGRLTSPRMVRSGSQFLRQKRESKLQSRYKRYLPSNFVPDPEATLFLVCYHLPVKLSKSSDDGVWTAEWNRDSLISRSEGSIAETMTVKWVGCVTYQARRDDEDLSDLDKEQITSLLAGMDCIPVFIDRMLAADHYQGYCKSKLWPMFHNIDILDIYSAVWDTAEKIEGKEERQNGAWWSAYQRVNHILANQLVSMMGKKDTIWVHDYHLLLFPSNVVELCKQQERTPPRMVFFLHVPFPTSEIFRELSHGPQLIEGVLAADVVGFHSFDHARHFLNACKRFLGLTYQSRSGGNLGVDYRGKNVVITISHVGLETETIRKALKKPEVLEAARQLREKHKGKILIAGVDVCQRLSGVPLKLLAFEQFFNMCPAWKDKLCLVQRCYQAKSRPGDQEWSKHEVQQLVDRITSQHGEGCIDYEVPQSPLSLDERLVLWLACDILLVTSTREGLNLRPLEFVLAKGEAEKSRPGVVIVSEFSACCCVLNGGIRINPWNITGVVNALDQALTMSDEERLGRRARDLPYLTNQPAANWTKQVLTVLQESEKDEDEFTDMGYMDHEIGGSHVLRIGDASDFKQLKIGRVLDAYSPSRRRVFLLDYGGTLVPRENMSMYVKKDFTAVTGKKPSPRMVEALRKLSSDPMNTVFVVSGVSRKSLMNSIGHLPEVGLAAETGALYSWGKSKARQMADMVGGNVETLDDGRMWHRQSIHFDWAPLRELVDPILKAYCGRTNGSVVRYLEQCICWNYRSTDPEWGMLQVNSLQADLEPLLAEYQVNIVRKKGQLEIVPDGLNKGVVARRILTQNSMLYGSHPEFIFCIGDDSTDESMFKAIYDYYAERSEESVHGRAGVLQHVFTCTVGKKPSHAHLYVNNAEDVEELMEALGEQA